MMQGSASDPQNPPDLQSASTEQHPFLLRAEHTPEHAVSSNDKPNHAHQTTLHSIAARITTLRQWWRSPFAATSLLRRYRQLALEIGLVLVWTLLVAYPFLNLDPLVIPNGREYLSAIQSHHLWVQVEQCGMCAFWNGSVRGGAPAFADPYGSMLHPLVMLTTLGWGIINGSKLALVGALLMGGLAQLWLGYVLGHGRIARLWAALLAVTAGHLAGRIEIGTFGLVLSTAACMLVLPPLIALTRSGSLRMAVVLGITLALALLAGQGYMQIGMLLLLPLALLLVPWQRARLVLLAQRGVIATGIAFLLAAPFLIPLLHFLPQFGKDIDVSFGSGQPFAYVPLNLVIDDPDFYRSDALQKLPYPYLYLNFVGWIPVGFALWGLLGSRRRADRRVVIFLASLALAALFVASRTCFAILSSILPDPLLTDTLAGIRFYPVIAGLAISPILALAGFGIDRLCRTNWPRLFLGINQLHKDNAVALDLRWVLSIPLVLALLTAWSFSTHWINTFRLGPEIATVVDALDTPDVQWVDTPFGEHFYIVPSIQEGLKLANGIRPWHWQERANPEPLVVAQRLDSETEMVQQDVVSNVPIYRADDEAFAHQYARVLHDDGNVTRCTAQGAGGHIDVACDLTQPGTLVVQEHSWSGWRAHNGAHALQLRPGDWLTMRVSSGEQRIQLRYRPWDVPLGLALCLSGMVLVVYYWREGDDIPAS